jgi:hypothetical protein
MNGIIRPGDRGGVRGIGQCQSRYKSAAGSENLGDQNLQLVEMVPGRWQLILNGQEQLEERWLVEVGDSVKMKKLQPPPPESAP